MCIALLISGILIWFNLPYSPTKAEFTKLTNYQITKVQTQNGVFTTEDIAKLPSPVQKHFQYCGYTGTSKISNMKVYYNDVDFVAPDKSKLKIKYVQYNAVDEPERIALIDTSMYGIPFEGIDAYQNGAGSMKVLLPKILLCLTKRVKRWIKQVLLPALLKVC